MTEDEKYVRERWKESASSFCLRTYEAARTYEVSVGGKIFSPKPKNAELTWTRAAEFTRTRLEQIRDVEKEISYLNYAGAVMHGHLLSAHRRILAREQAALADLKRGLRVAE